MLEGREDLEYHEKVDWDAMKAKIEEERKKGFLSRYPQIARTPLLHQSFPVPDHIQEERRRVTTLIKSALPENNTRGYKATTIAFGTITAGLLLLGEKYGLRSTSPEDYFSLGLLSLTLTVIPGLMWLKKAHPDLVNGQASRTPQSSR